MHSRGVGCIQGWAVSSGGVRGSGTGLNARSHSGLDHTRRRLTLADAAAVHAVPGGARAVEASSRVHTALLTPAVP